LIKPCLKQRLEGSDRLSSQQQAPVPIVQHKNERAVFDEVFLPHMAEAIALRQWLTVTPTMPRRCAGCRVAGVFAASELWCRQRSRVVADNRAQRRLQLV